MRKVSMPRKKREPEPWEGQTCGTCAVGTWSTKFCNLDHEGKPFVKECEHATFATTNEGKHIALKSTRACKFWRAEL